MHEPATKKLFLITNRHVVIKEGELFFPDTLKLRLHVDPNDLGRSEFYNLRLYNDEKKKQKRWKDISPSIDVVAIELSFDDLKQFHFQTFEPTDFAPAGTRLAVGEPVVIIGYPVGFHDTLHNLPVARQRSGGVSIPDTISGKSLFLG